MSCFHCDKTQECECKDCDRCFKAKQIYLTVLKGFHNTDVEPTTRHCTESSILFDWEPNNVIEPKTSLKPIPALRSSETYTSTTIRKIKFDTDEVIQPTAKLKRVSPPPPLQPKAKGFNRRTPFSPFKHPPISTTGLSKLRERRRRFDELGKQEKTDNYYCLLNMCIRETPCCEQCCKIAKQQTIVQ